MDQLRAAFSLVPEYLRTLDRATPVLDYNEFQPQLGPADAGAQAVDAAALVRARGAAAADRAPPRARRSAFAAWRRRRPDWERLAPVPFSTVCFRYRPRRLAGREDEPETRGLARRHQHAADGRRQPHRRGVPVAHAAARPVHDPPRDRQPADRAAPRRAGVGRCCARGRAPGRRDTTRRRPHEPSPIEVLYFYRTRWGAHDEFVELFRRNHWPILREQLAAGRFTDVELWTPRFHGEGRADWDVLVSITYRDWAAIEEHSDAEIAAPPVPGPGDVQGARSSSGSRCSTRTGTSSLEARPLERAEPRACASAPAMMAATSHATGGRARPCRRSPS